MKAFDNFDWAGSSEWQMYYSNITPTPPGNKIPYFKKRFYRLKIDPDFDINWTPPQPQQNTNTTYTPRTPFTGFTPIYGNTLLSKSIAFLETISWIVSCIMLFSYYKYAMRVCLVTLVVRVFRRIGRPRFNMEFAQSLFLDEHFQLLLNLLLLTIDRQNVFCMLPYFITSIMNIFDFCRHYGIFAGLANKVINKRVALSEVRANSEIAIGFILLPGILLGVNSFLLPIFYWQFLRFKYIFSTDCSLAFGRLNSMVNKIKAKLPSPLQFVIGKIQQFFEFLGRTESKDGQAAGGSNCVIF